MADVSIKYKGVEKATLNASGSKTIKTSGKYCEADIVVDYTDPEKPTQTKSMSLGASAPSTVTPDSGKVLSSVSPSIDTSVIKAENIKQGVQMLGITGTHSGGITPSGTKNITENGTYDVTEFASANVNVSGIKIAQGTITLASSDFSISINHNLGTNKIIALVQRQTQNNIASWQFIQGSWISDEVLELGLESKSYTYSGTTFTSYPIGASGSASVLGANGQTQFYHTPAGYATEDASKSSDVFQRIICTDLNNVQLKTRYQFKSSETYSYTIIGW